MAIFFFLNAGIRRSAAGRSPKAGRDGTPRVRDRKIPAVKANVIRTAGRITKALPEARPSRPG